VKPQANATIKETPLGADPVEIEEKKKTL